MLSTLSLKYRIALVIFSLEALMMTMVLWQTLSSSLDATRQLHADNEKVMLQLLSDLSSTALLIEELADVQLYFQQVLQQPTVKRRLDHDHLLSGRVAPALTAHRRPVVPSGPLYVQSRGGIQPERARKSCRW